MIDERAQLGENVQIGQFVVIEADVYIGSDVEIDHHCVIKEGTIIEDGVKIKSFSLLGNSPVKNKKMARKPSEDLQPLIIERDVVIGSHVTLYKGTTICEGALIADHVSVREQTKIGKQSIIGRHAMVEPDTFIGERVTIQTGTYVTGGTTIEDNAFLGPCCAMSNDKYMASGRGHHKGPVIREGAKIGHHASLLPRVEIGKGAVVGAGAVVTKDVLPDTTVVGNPAKPLITKK
ncbi:DapH/DapD/GlmU-related protein [Bacillus sp. FSL W7-1360]